ncbi:hypothetical protein HOC73_00460 [bacterium]|nr:hypothetical protein [bacterium]MBT4495201.1 hypothetical protein [bacterium]
MYISHSGHSPPVSSIVVRNVFAQLSRFVVKLAVIVASASAHSVVWMIVVMLSLPVALRKARCSLIVGKRLVLDNTFSWLIVIETNIVTINRLQNILFMAYSFFCVFCEVY